LTVSTVITGPPDFRTTRSPGLGTVICENPRSTVESRGDCARRYQIAKISTSSRSIVADTAPGARIVAKKARKQTDAQTTQRFAQRSQRVVKI
jgi:hypothetical protein